MRIGNLQPAFERLVVMRSIVAVAVFSLLTVACGAGERVVDTTTVAPTVTTEAPDLDSQLGALAEARALWAAGAPTDYTVRRTDACDGCDPTTVAVHAGEVVTLASVEASTIDDVFSSIESALRAGASVEVEYHPELGYPIRLVIDLDGDGRVDVDLTFGDLEAMPIVTSLEELLSAKRLWDMQQLGEYTYIFRADCTCPEGGTFEVYVQHGRVASIRPLDDVAESSTLSPGDLDDAFTDLEHWFTDSSELIDQGILEVDVRMDPQFGYPRWFRVVAESLDNDGLEGRFEIVVTIDLIHLGPPVDVEPDPGTVDADREDLEAAHDRWTRAAIDDYEYVLTIHCECPAEVAGPFRVQVRDGVVTAVGSADDVLADDPNIIAIDTAFDMIGRAIDDGTDVDVAYHPVIGFPERVIIDTEAVAVDGGLAFSISDLQPLDGMGIIAVTVLAGPQCPVQMNPPQAGCEDKPVLNVPIFVGRPDAGGLVPVGEAVDGTMVMVVAPGDYSVTGQATEGLFGPDVVDITLEAGAIVDVEVRYDTGIR